MWIIINIIMWIIINIISNIVFIKKYLFSFTFTVSITYTTSGIVTLVSAIFVLTTILRTPDG